MKYKKKRTEIWDRNTIKCQDVRKRDRQLQFRIGSKSSFLCQPCCRFKSCCLIIKVNVYGITLTDWLTLCVLYNADILHICICSVLRSQDSVCLSAYRSRVSYYRLFTTHQFLAQALLCSISETKWWHYKSFLQGWYRCSQRGAIA